MVEVPAIKRAGERQINSSTLTARTLNCKWSGIEIVIDQMTCSARAPIASTFNVVYIQLKVTVYLQIGNFVQISIFRLKY